MGSELDHVSGESSPFLTVDERVQWLLEETKPKYKVGNVRYQHIWVRRGDKACMFTKELGPAILFPTQGLCFWGAGEYSVGEAMEIADRLRENKPPEQRDPTRDILDSFRKQQDEKRDLAHHRTRSGPHITVVRS